MPKEVAVHPQYARPDRQVCGDLVLLLAKGFAVPAGSASGPQAKWAPDELPTLVPWGLMEGVRVRGRGALMTACRVVGAVLGLVPVMGYVAGDVARTTVVVTSCMAVAWQLWLVRPGVKVSGSTVLLQGLLKDRSVPARDVDSFTVAVQRQPGDLLDRSVHLVINMDDGSADISRWVAWQDMVSPWMVGQRPLPTRSQRRVIDRLNTGLAARKAADADADSAADVDGTCP